MKKKQGFYRLGESISRSALTSSEFYWFFFESNGKGIRPVFLRHGVHRFGLVGVSKSKIIFFKTRKKKTATGKQRGNDDTDQNSVNTSPESIMAIVTNGGRVECAKNNFR